MSFGKVSSYTKVRVDRIFSIFTLLARQPDSHLCLSLTLFRKITAECPQGDDGSDEISRTSGIEDLILEI